MYSEYGLREISVSEIVHDITFCRSTPPAAFVAPFLVQCTNKKTAAGLPELHDRTDLNTLPTMDASVPDNSHPILNNYRIILTLPHTNTAPMTLEGAPNG